MPVTLKDIAEQTGVSPSVVSTVLSGRDNGTFVSDQTRRKVLQVAEMMNYTPVRSGRPRGSRRLRRLREEHFIGIWAPHYSPMTAYYVQNLQTALQTQSEQAGAASEDDYGLRLLTQDDLPRLDAIGLMGMILLSPLLLPREAAAASIPTVMIGETDNPPREMVQVHTDNHLAGRLLGEHLWGLGHRRMALLAAGAHPRVANQRFHGLKSVCSGHADESGEIVPVQYDNSPLKDERQQVRHAVLQLYGAETKSEERPSALLCASESVAAVALQTLAELGLAVPRDVSVTAFGDTPRLAEDMTPSLTVVRDPAALIADAALMQLALLHDEKVPDDPAQRNYSFPCELIIRSSTAAFLGA